MEKLFVVEDALHSEVQGEFKSMEEAISELQRLAKIPWNQEPNQAPCTNWKNCGRRYEMIEHDTTSEPWEELCRTPMLHINANTVRWTPTARNFNSDRKVLKDQFTKSFKIVRKVLMDEWDPIGISWAKEAQDEYDTYVNEILSISQKELSVETVTSYLMTVRQESMRLPPNEEKDTEIAIRLTTLLINKIGNLGR